MLILLSHMTSLPSIVTPSGLIYKSVESVYKKHLYNFGSIYFNWFYKSYDSSNVFATSSMIFIGIFEVGSKKNLWTLFVYTY